MIYLSANSRRFTVGDTKASKAEEFREEQKAQAAKQNLTAENAVPEQRPQAFNTPPDQDNDLTKRLREEGALPSEEPMPPEAYERARQNVQKSKGKGKRLAAHVGTVVEVLSGDHRGRFGAVTQVISYHDDSERLLRVMGGPDADFIMPKEVLVTFRGDARDGERVTLNLDDIEFKVHTEFKGRAFVMGAG
jgi:hypothetical protein